VEKLAEVDVVAMDKTGTLTTGELKVERVESFPPGREREVAQLAYSLERLSTHPLARAITRHGKQQQLAALELDHFESVTGLGLRARRNGNSITLGKRDWLSQGSPAKVLADVPPTDASFSEIWLANGDLIGRVLLRDDIRPQARRVVEALRREGLQTVVLTGDRKSNADHLKQELDLDDVRAELKPEQKVSVIQSFTAQRRPVAMVGDGVNDAAALAQADLGLAMGTGADVAIEASDITLVRGDLRAAVDALQLSRRTFATINGNLFWAFAYNLAALPLAAAGLLNPMLAGAAMALSSVFVVSNSLRLRRFKPSKSRLNQEI